MLAAKLHLKHIATAEHATQTKTFLGSLGPTRKTERARLQADHHRTLAVLDAIDTAAHGGAGRACDLRRPTIMFAVITE
ncbi:hypothetical protein ABT297_23910 [Dactylosporangium sp. NPDC000555]|uniref:hypothetical protein n=1 Tax=Dactylosporangium sp. NPDC000555 TaxID=3154260 RepID=UPI003326888E